MKPFIAALVLILLSANLFAQNKTAVLSIQGSVTDSSSGKPLPFVTIGLQDRATQKTIRSVLSKEDGSFLITGTAGKAYQLELAFVGFASKTISISETSGTVTLGSLSLANSGQDLQVVAITAVKPLIRRSPDGISYDVQSDPETPALTALDIVRKVPLLTVDASDNIKLKGSGNYKILINGKESALMAKNPSDVLRAMPATNIEKIEVITTPPAKYDAEGLAGIINITLKKNTDQGYTLGVNGRYNSVWGPGINLNGTLKQGKIGLTAFMGTNKRRPQSFGSGSSQLFYADQSVLSQDGSNRNTGHNYYGNAELSYEVDSLDLVTANVETFIGGFDQTGYQRSTTTDANQQLSQQYLADIVNNGTYAGLDASLNYQRNFKRDKNQLLTLSYKYSYSPFTQSTGNVFSDTLNFSSPNYQQYNKSGSREHTVQIDYAHPVKKWTIEAGAKGIFRDNFSDFESSNYDAVQGKYISNPLQSDQFSYRQNVYGFYNSYQLKLDKWSFKGGVRLEHTSVRGDFTSSNALVSQDYNNVVPSINIQHTIGKSSFGVAFTDRIQRPGIFQLNPFVDLSNPKFISTGNPDLHPELLHNFELNYSHFAKNSITAGLSYGFSNNTIQPVNTLRVDSTGSQRDTVTVTSYQNLGFNKVLGLNLNTNFTLTPALTLTLNGQLNRIWVSGSYNGVYYKNDGYTGNAEANAAYKFKKGFRFSIDAGFFSGDVTLQGKTNNFLYSSYVLSKSFWGKKATVSMVVNNPYSRVFTGRSNFHTVDFYQTSYNQMPYRTYAIRINYKIGKLNSDIKRSEKNISNDDTKSGGKSGGGNQ